MEKQEARALLQKELDFYRRLSFSKLEQLIGKIDARELTAPSGGRYQLEIQFFWDDEPPSPIRVVGAIDDR